MNQARFRGAFALILVLMLVLAGCSTPQQQAEPAGNENTEAQNAGDTDEESAGDTDEESAGDTDEESAGDTDDTDAAANAVADGEEFVFGMILVGPYNDAGWSQAHYEGAKYAEEKIDNTKFIYVDKVNAADRPNVTVEQIVDDLVSQNAKLIITNSDDFKDGTHAAAKLHPDIPFIHISGDGALTGDASENVSNLMGKMTYGKMIAGCAAALQSETGSISYLGPLINDETRRLVNAAYLGAVYCNENLRDEPFADLSFEVVWIGFWFNIPGVTLDPTQVANNFINGGSDVIISGIDTTEALVEAHKATEAGKTIYAIPYDFIGACEQAEDVCLGVPYFNWGPAYVDAVTDAITREEGEWNPTWDWLNPTWDDLNDLDSSAIGFMKGNALSDENKAKLDTFIDGLASEDITLFAGPLNFQDGSVYLEDGEEATEEQIWYTPQLLEGIEGQSSADAQD
jgi:simple sugar transport system substrate-binding protein